jgi:signal transduction histidine kinase
VRTSPDDEPTADGIPLRVAADHRRLAGLWPHRDLEGALMGPQQFASTYLAKTPARVFKVPQAAVPDVFTEAPSAAIVTSEFAATASHELRTSVMNILGFAELLGTGCFGPLTATQSDAVDRIERNCERLRQLVEPFDRLLGREPGGVDGTA